MKPLLLSVGLLALVPLAVRAEEPAKAPDSLQQLVYLGERQPVHVRLHILSDGKPFPAVWDEFVGGLFRFLDRNADGQLDREEAERAPRAQNLKAALAGNFMASAGGATATMTQLDANRDGKVTPQELTLYYRRFGLTALQINYSLVYGRGDNPLTEALFRHLDVDQDGKLTREEVRGVAAAMAKLDLDDDELIGPGELAPSYNTSARPTGMMMGIDNAWQYLPKDSPFALVDPTDQPRRLAEQLVARYDRDMDQQLTRAEVGVPDAVFAALDANKDGKLDGTELGQYLAGSPDLDMSVRLGPAESKAKALEIQRALSKKPDLAADTSADEAGSVQVALGEARLELRALPSGVGSFADARRNVHEQFKAVRGQKDFIDRAEADRSGIFGAMFRFVDRDGDGKMTEKELNIYLDLLARGAVGSTVLSISDHGRMLFDLLDTNRDGRLGPRELRGVWERLAAWDRNADGAIGRDEVPRRFQLVLSAGQPGNAGGTPDMVTALNRMIRESTSKLGPLWFRKMDRNGDGDLSPREWLGTPADFKRADSNQDGLIEVQEAERFDAQLRPKGN